MPEEKEIEKLQDTVAKIEDINVLFEDAEVEHVFTAENEAK